MADRSNSVNSNDVGVGDKLNYEFQQACCRPTARCFKGYSILFAIWAFAGFVLAAFIPPLVRSHGDNEVTHPTEDINVTPEEIRQRLKTMITSTVIISIVFVGISVLSLFMMFKYRGIEAAQNRVRLVEDETNAYDTSPGQRSAGGTIRLDNTEKQ